MSSTVQEKTNENKSFKYKIAICILSIITLIGITVGVVSNMSLTTPSGRYQTLLVEKQNLLNRQNVLTQSIQRHKNNIPVMEEKYKKVSKKYYDSMREWTREQSARLGL